MVQPAASPPGTEIARASPAAVLNPMMYRAVVLWAVDHDPVRAGRRCLGFFCPILPPLRASRPTIGRAA
jgi:hypothetical protein